MSRPRLTILKRSEPLRIGVLPITDCAPLIYAQEAGLFEKYGLEVELRRETSWANILDKVISGELDAAPAPATLPFLVNLGLESDPCACVSAMVLNLQGNAILLSAELWEQGAREAASFRDRIYASWGKRTYTFAVTSPYSLQHLLLRRWLKSGGIAAESEVRVVVVPPEQLFPTLKLGYIDGYCASEPWISVAVEAGAGRCVVTGAELAPMHPENVLMVRQSFARGRSEEHECLLATLLESCALCDLLPVRRLLCELLAHPQYINAPAESLQPGLIGPFESGGFPLPDALQLTVFSQQNANDPNDDKAAWIMAQLYEALGNSIFHWSPGRSPVLKNVFRRDIFDCARSRVRAQNKHETQNQAENLALVNEPA